MRPARVRTEGVVVVGLMEGAGEVAVDLVAVVEEEEEDINKRV